jgi:hypothetical protein
LRLALISGLLMTKGLALVPLHVVAAAPLVFSTGAPTYITPRLESVSVNVTIGQVGRAQVAKDTYWGLASRGQVMEVPRRLFSPVHKLLNPQTC